ncbi:GNAT family N-acetyltransferase [Persicimonas caeni]|uniref:GNAT family N-acetyltransferase n=1 Tax=Persicimonas caeni TaxID=2292766 RepID=A0A4Y6PSE1_PERCE|nr:GNAT family N-acetyltransferase [Persicimonas caeni]QDG51160.1 GNAT family N-acetyltransferase [Persicimonas caeni]QED32381.1 GNAT family N-acetyltransferase [Persicimonas caeni]
MSETNLVIRPVDDADLAAVAEIARHTLRDFVVESGGDADLFNVDFLRSTLDASTILVAVDDDEDQVVGYLQFQLRPPTLIVNGAAMRPAWQRRGVGTRLFGRAVERATEADCTRVDISVQPANESVYQLYLRLGFAEGDNPTGWNQELSMDIDRARRLLAERQSAPTLSES